MIIETRHRPPVKGPDLAELWARRFPPTHVVDGRLRVVFGKALCAFNVPPQIGVRVLATANTDLYQVPTCERGIGLWTLFATPDGPLDSATMRRLRDVRAAPLKRGSADLPLPGEDTWQVNLRCGTAIPTRSHLVDLILASPRGAVTYEL